MDQAFFVTVKTVIDIRLFLSHTASKRIRLIHIKTCLTPFTFYLLNEPTFLFKGYSLALTRSLLNFLVPQKETMGFGLLSYLLDLYKAGVISVDHLVDIF